jgi:hypothetical protein
MIKRRNHFYIIRNDVYACLDCWRNDRARPRAARRLSGPPHRSSAQRATSSSRASAVPSSMLGHSTAAEFTHLCGRSLRSHLRLELTHRHRWGLARPAWILHGCRGRRSRGCQARVWRWWCVMKAEGCAVQEWEAVASKELFTYAEI